MKPQFKIQAQKVCLRSVIPLLVSASSYLIEQITTNACIQQLQTHTIRYCDYTSLIRNIREMFTQVYASYPNFIVTMVLIHLGLEIAQLVWTKLVAQPEYLLINPKRLSQKSLPDKGAQALGTHPPHSGSEMKDSSLPQWKQIGNDVFEVIVQYSLTYCLILFICTIIPCIFSSSFVLWKRGEATVQQPREQGVDSASLGRSPKIDSPVVLFEDNRNKTERMLTFQDTNDIATILYSLSLEDTYDAMAVSEDRELLMFKGGEGTRLDLSDLTSPTILTPGIKLNFTHLPYAHIYLISPDAQSVIVSNSDDLYLFNCSNPGIQAALKLPAEYLDVDYPPSFAFSSDSKYGYFGNGNLYQFSTSSLDIIQISSFGKADVTCILISNSGDIAFVGLFDSEKNLGFLRIINITDVHAPQTINDFNVDDVVNLLTISSDDKTLYISFQSPLMPGILNISNLSSPNYYSTPSGIAKVPNQDLILSPDGTILVVLNPYPHAPLIVTDISDPENPIFFSSTILGPVDNFIFLPKSRLAFAVTTTGYEIVTFSVNLKLEDQISVVPLNPTTSSAANMDKVVKGIALSDDKTTIVAAGYKTIQTFLVSDQKNLTSQGAVDAPQSNWIIPVIEQDIAFVSYQNWVTIFNLTDGTNFSSIYHADANDELSITFAVLPNRKTVLKWDALSDQPFSSSVLFAVDYTNLTSPSKPHIIARSNDFSCFSQIVFSTSGDLLVLSECQQLSIYNISNLTNVTLLGRKRISVDSDIIQITIAPNNATLLVTTNDFDSDFNVDKPGVLLVLDISQLPSIKEISSINISPRFDQSTVPFFPPVAVSPDSSTAFIPQGLNILVVRISDTANPTLIGFIHNPLGQMYLYVNFLSNSSTFPLLLTDSSGTLYTSEYEPQYAIQVYNQTVKRGEAIPDKMVVLEKNNADGYNLKAQDCQIVSASLYNLSLVNVNPETTYQLLPNWINFNKDTQTLSLNPTSDVAARSYYIYSSISTKVSTDEFSAINNLTDFTELVSALLAYGYIDTQFYLTKNFDQGTTMFLPPQYNSSEPDIRKILSTHYFAAVIPISVESSLSLNQESMPLSVDTLSQLPLSISISLIGPPTDSDDTQSCQFVEKSFSIITPTFQDDYTVVNIVSPLFEANDALKNIYINVPDGLVCAGKVIVRDGLNSDLYERIENISNYFQSNQDPKWNWTNSLQDEIDKTPLSTGTYFTIILNENMFNQGDLKYNFATSESTSWITQAGLTLSGTPPEPILPQFWPSKYDLVLEAKNQYRSLEKSFTLKVHMSVNYYWKLLLKLAGIITLWVYFYTFYNLVFKSYYRHPKDWLIRIGKEIKPDDLHPIVFIYTELRESKFIIKQLQRSVAKELGIRSISKPKLAELFYNTTTQKIDVDRLVQAIEKAIGELPFAKKNEVKQYAPGTNSRKDLIDQLILNEIVMALMNTKQEIATQRVFKQLKRRWTELVQRNQLVLWEFTVDSIKLEHELITKYSVPESSFWEKELYQLGGSPSKSTLQSNTGQVSENESENTRSVIRDSPLQIPGSSRKQEVIYNVQNYPMLILLRPPKSV